MVWRVHDVIARQSAEPLSDRYRVHTIWGPLRVTQHCGQELVAVDYSGMRRAPVVANDSHSLPVLSLVTPGARRGTWTSPVVANDSHSLPVLSLVTPQAPVGWARGRKWVRWSERRDMTDLCQSCRL